MKCKVCGGKVVANQEKLKLVIGGSLGIMLIGLMSATPTGWLALLAAGTSQAHNILRLKLKLFAESHKAGGYFQCDGCGRDVGLLEVLGNL